MFSVLKDLIKSVPYNVSLRYDCPICGNNNTLSISNLNGIIKYYCFSAGCSVKGTKTYLPSTEDIGRILKERAFIEEFNRFEPPTYLKYGISSVNVFKRLEAHNGLKAYYKGKYKVGYDPVRQRLLYLLMEEGTVKGAIGRSLIGESPKVLVYKDSKIMPFIVGNTDTGVLVEDCASATAIASDDAYTGIALLGTRLKLEYIPYLTRFKRLIIALDPDARVQAIKLKQALAYVHKEVIIWNIPIDFKNMDNAELQEFLVCRN